MRMIPLAVACTALLVVAGQTQAGLITLNELQDQTVAGQNFTFVFNPAGLSDGTDGTFTLHARGDYGDSNASARDDENLDWSIEGIAGAGPVGSFNANGSGGVGGPFDSVILHSTSRDYEFTRTYTISGADLLAITADNAVTISVDLGGSVGTLELPRFVEVTLEYNMVPEPSSIALLGMGGLSLVGHGWRRKRKAELSA